MKVYTTTPKHDKPFSLTSMDIIAMFDMFEYWAENADKQLTIKPTPDNTNVYLFVNPKDREWTSMRECSFILIHGQSDSIEPFMLS